MAVSMNEQVKYGRNDEMRSDRRRQVKRNKILLGVGIIILLVLVAIGFYRFGVASVKTSVGHESSLVTSTSKKPKTKSSSQIRSTSASTQSNVDDAKTTVFNLATLSYDQERKIVAYAVSMKAFIDGKPQPQQFDSRFSEFSVRDNQAQATYYEGMNAYGTLSNSIVRMTVKPLDSEGTLLIQDNDTGKMSKISLDQIDEDEGTYVDDHNELSR